MNPKISGRISIQENTCLKNS